MAEHQDMVPFQITNNMLRQKESLRIITEGKWGGGHKYTHNTRDRQITLIGTVARPRPPPVGFPPPPAPRIRQTAGGLVQRHVLFRTHDTEQTANHAPLLTSPRHSRVGALIRVASAAE